VSQKETLFSQIYPFLVFGLMQVDKRHSVLTKILAKSLEVLECELPPEGFT